VDSIA
jgi:long-chain-fatty-acid--CoA ligase ACSBG